MAVCSLRMTIAGLTAGTVLIVAITTLAITLSVSIAALREIGKHHAAAIAVSAKGSLENYFETPTQSLLQVANFTRSPGITLPTDQASGSDVLARWVDTNCNAFRFSNDQYGVVATWFLDGNYVACWNEFRFPELYGAYITRVDLAGDVVNDGIWFYRANNTRVPDWHQIYVLGSDISSLTDWRTSGILPQLHIGTGASTRAVWLTLKVTNLNNQVSMFAVAAAPLFNGSNVKVGFVTITLEATTLSRFVRGIGGTPNTRVFAVDARGFLFASSMATPFITHGTAPRNTLAPPGCTSSQDVLDADSVEVTIACRASASEYPYAPLQALAADTAFLTSTTGQLRFQSIGGEKYYVVSEPVRMRLTGMPLSLILTMPEKDIVGDVVTGRNIAIGVTSAVFVVTAAVAALLISRLLAPLGVISERMYKAAAFEDDATTDNEYSVMSEIAELQDAYYCMNFELNRIKSFVPQSVLQSKMEDDDDPDLTEDLDTTTTCTDVDSQSTAKVQAQLSKRRLTDASGDGGLNRSGGGVGDDRASNVTGRSSQRSKQRRRGAGPLVGGLRTSAGLTNDNVSVVFVNLRGFHERIATATIDEVLRGFESTVSVVMREVMDHKGIVDSFHGDHFFATFNAVKPCPAHPRRAVAAARAIVRALSSQGFQLPVVTAVANGRCHAGNVGNDHMKKFSILGPVVSQAAYLERMAKVYPSASCLISSRTIPEIDTHHSFNVLDIVDMPFANRPVLIADVVGEVNSDASGEWLYVVNDNSTRGASGDLKLRNEAFQMLWEAKVPRARAIFDTLPEESRTKILENLVRQAVEQPSDAPPVTNWGVLQRAIACH